jgi:predicted acyltransferase
MSAGATPGASKRLEPIDQFRGLTIVLMVLANFSADIDAVPAWLKHAHDVGFTVIDQIAPLFVFAMALTFGLSFERRAARDGAARAAGQMVRRLFALIGIGCVLGAGEIRCGFNPSGFNWGVLQALGAAGLLTLPTLRLPAWARVVVAAGLLVVYDIALDHGWREVVLGSPHGGLEGTLGWAAMMILGTALATLYNCDRRGLFALAAALVLGAGLAALPWVPISKNRVSPSYVLVATGVSGLVFAAFDVLVGRLRVRLPLLTAWGRNPLVLYAAHLVALSIFAIPSAPWWFHEAPLWQAALQAAGLIAILHLLARELDRRGWVVAL